MKASKLISNIFSITVLAIIALLGSAQTGGNNKATGKTKADAMDTNLTFAKMMCAGKTPIITYSTCSDESNGWVTCTIQYKCE